MNKNAAHSPASEALHEEDLRFCQKLAGLLTKLGVEEEWIRKIMAEVKTYEQVDHLFGWISERVLAALFILKSRA